MEFLNALFTAAFDNNIVFAQLIAMVSVILVAQRPQDAIRMGGLPEYLRSGLPALSAGRFTRVSCCLGACPILLPLAACSPAPAPSLWAAP